MRDAFGKWHFANAGEKIMVKVKGMRTFLGFKPSADYVPEEDLGEHDPNKGDGSNDAQKAEVARIKAMTKAELADYLVGNAIPFNDSDNKATLLELALSNVETTE